MIFHIHVIETTNFESYLFAFSKRNIIVSKDMAVQLYVIVNVSIYLICVFYRIMLFLFNIFIKFLILVCCCVKFLFCLTGELVIHTIYICKFFFFAFKYMLFQCLCEIRILSITLACASMVGKVFIAFSLCVFALP